MHKFFLKSAMLSSAISLALSGCGGSNNENGTTTTSQSLMPGQTAGQYETGVVIDSPIQGLAYQTSSGLHGTTNSRGEFSYIDGDTVTFTLASIEFPAILAKDAITPFDIFSTEDFNDNRVVNFLRLVQSLDDDGQYKDTITLSNSYQSVLRYTDISLDDLSLDPASFAARPALISLIQQVSHLPAMVSEENALIHFKQTLSSSGLIDTDGDGIPNSEDTDDDNDLVLDKFDVFPLDASEHSDLDHDGIGDNADPDDDNDSIPDELDPFNQYTLTLAASVPDIADQLIDYQNNRLYLTHKYEKSMSVIDLSHGQVIHTVNFTEMPQRLIMSSDGSEIYVALLTAEYDSQRYTPDQSGKIAVINTSDMTVSHTFPILIDPFDMVVTTNGKLIVSPGSGQRSEIHAYNVSTGAQLGSETSVRQSSYLSLHPSDNWVISADTDLSPSEIHKFDISGTGITYVSDSPYHGDHRMSGNVWATPDDVNLITRGGDVFLASDMTYVTSITELNHVIDHVQFDETKRVAMLLVSELRVENNAKLLTISLDTLQTIQSTPIDGSTYAFYTTGAAAYYFTGSRASTSITVKEHPCLNCN